MKKQDGPKKNYAQKAKAIAAGAMAYSKVKHEYIKRGKVKTVNKIKGIPSSAIPTKKIKPVGDTGYGNIYQRTHHPHSAVPAVPIKKRRKAK
jgi:hypothetical protein